MISTSSRVILIQTLICGLHLLYMGNVLLGELKIFSASSFSNCLIFFRLLINKSCHSICNEISGFHQLRITYMDKIQKLTQKIRQLSVFPLKIIISMVMVFVIYLE